MGITCSATTIKGQPCRAWAIRDSQPPLCSAHAGRNTGSGAPAGNQNRRTHGFYALDFTEQELADLVAMPEAVELIDELAAARIHLRRLILYLSEHFEAITPSTLATLSPLVTASLNTIASLARSHHLIAGNMGEGVAAAIGQALDDLGDLWEVEL